MRVIGTAGHVDHGKSTLVHALTGINPDRLREEQDRQMTIDLGFAWMSLPGGEEIGLVDVPGHRDFIENMLAGVTGIDAALLVVAADEGVMPQTREHLAILDLLDVRRGVVALTKTDLVDDPSWLDLVTQEVQELLRPTPLAGAPVVPVSAVTRLGLEDLLQALSDAVHTAPARPDLGRPRLPIDRAFTIAGFGTVVTGTLSGGFFAVGDEVEILPAGRPARIRGLQTHKHKVERAVPGSRTAANLAGVEVRQLERGDVVVRPGTYRPTLLLDVRFRLLPQASAPLRHDQQVKIFIGAAQCLGRVRLLGADELAPGEDAWLQLVVRKPVVADRGDHFILRRPSPGETLGGGQVVEAHPSGLYRRRDAAVIDRLERQLRGTPGDVLQQTLAAAGPVPLDEAVRRSGLDAEAARQAIAELLEDHRLVVLGGDAPTPEWAVLVMDGASWQALLARLRSALSTYHDAYPLRLGMPREELKNRLELESKAFVATVRRAVAEDVVREYGPRLQLPDRPVRLTARQQVEVEELLKRFRQAPYATPSVKECAAAVGEDVLDYLIESEQLVRLSEDVVLESQTYQDVVKQIRQLILERGSITVAEVRDRFQTSRKYALALMEHLDAVGVTVRDGDARRLAKPGG
ncbi:MAG: selenocysteine-specific translation elongation factor [Chloroflexota bacterium]